MTREEAINHLKTVAKSAIDSGYDSAVVDAVSMAREALEQESILDKIRAEIEQKCCITVGSENEPAITLYDVFQIIDKYKAESEGEE